MSWLALSLLSVLFWSGSDFFSKLGSPPEDRYSHWKMVTAVGAVMGIHALYLIIFCNVNITFQAIIAYLPASLLYIASMTIGYVALRYVELSLSSPVSNASGAVAAIFCFFLLSEEIAPLTVVGIVLVSIGVILLGIVEITEDEDVRIQRQEASNRKYVRSALAIILPILYCVIDAGGTVADAVILENMAEETANVAYDLTFFAVGLCAAVYVFVIRREKPIFSREFPKLVGGVCETAGQVFYIGALSSYAVGTAPVVSSYCILSVLWSRVFLKEKLTIKHYLTVFLVILGILVLGVAEGIAE